LKRDWKKKKDPRKKRKETFTGGRSKQQKEDSSLSETVAEKKKKLWGRKLRGKKRMVWVKEKIQRNERLVPQGTSRGSHSEKRHGNREGTEIIEAWVVRGGGKRMRENREE